MADVASLLHASLQPATRKQAEQQLHQLTPQDGFLSHLLQLILNKNIDPSVRLAGGIYLKNVAKLRWEEDVAPLPEQEKANIRSQLVPSMIALSSPGEKTIRAQIAESVALIAELDFPTQWSDLITQLVQSLSPQDYTINVGVLETAHSIFRQWRAQSASNQLYSEINLVLSQLMNPFLELFRHTAGLLLSSPSPVNIDIVTQSQILLAEIFYDFTCHDLPPGIEDAHNDFFAPDVGLFQRFLSWDPPGLRGQFDDVSPSLPARLKTVIFEIAELYVKLYPEQLLLSSTVPSFMRGVLAVVGSRELSNVANDQLVSQALRFISSAIRSTHFKTLFSSKEDISSLVREVVLPNVGLRDHETEQFEDDPLEFIRLDLALPSGSGGVGFAEACTRRQAAADVLQALVGSGFQTEATEIVGSLINSALATYSSDPGEQWRSKDSAVYLLTAIATETSTAKHGVTSINAQVDVVEFFSQHILLDLQAVQGGVHPILQVDAIRFLLTFRNQLTKEQLLSVLPLLANHLKSENYVAYTYAAITIDRILFMKKGSQLVFAQADVHDIATDLLHATLVKIEGAGTPEKIAENDHLMKCAMRVIITARQTLTPLYQQVLQRLVAILGAVSKNPSNPNFDHCLFESISALMRFVVRDASTLADFEQALFPHCTLILQQDIDQYIPYVFQILAQMLEMHTTGVTGNYRALLPFLFMPACWQQKGSIPALVKLLKAFLACDVNEMMAKNQIPSVLAIVQQRLIPSKINDVWGFELLQAVVQYVPPAHLKQYFRVSLMTLLTRMQTSKTDRYVYHFSLFLLFTMAINVEGLAPDYVISTVEEIQPQLWSQVLISFIIPQIPKMPHKDRKVAAIGMTRMLTESRVMGTEPTARSWMPAFTALVKLFQEPQYLVKSSSNDDTATTGITEIDYEEQTAGYQAAYSRLAAADKPPVDPVAYVKDPRAFLGQALSRARVGALLTVSEPGIVKSFVESLVAEGYSIQ
ncbi:CAS/CSE protein [Scleroderma yunnanense]